MLGKTGTITHGRPEVSTIDPAAGWSADELLALLAAVEVGSEHPVAEAIVTAARDRNLELSPVHDFAAVPGHGVTAIVGGRRVAAGNAALVAAEGVDITALTARAESRAAEGATPVFVAVGGQAAGLVGVSDTVKPDSAAAIAQLKALGLRLVMRSAPGSPATRTWLSWRCSHRRCAAGPRCSRAKKCPGSEPDQDRGLSWPRPGRPPRRRSVR